jgi:cell division protein FtsQ
LIHIDVKGIQRRVAAVPRVATVTIRRDWPAALVIVVTERAAIGVVAAGKRFQEIDSGGVVFGVPGPRPAGLVLVSATGAAREAVAATLAELPLAIYSRVDSASATTGDDVTFKLRSGQTIVWGSADKGPAKSSVLVALMARVKAHRYDVSAPELPTTS